MKQKVTKSHTETKCICGSIKYDTIISNNDFKIIMCTKCNLSRTYPPCELNELYSGKEHIQHYVKNKKLFLSFMKKIFKEVQIFKKGGKLLEIGCSVGYLLEIAKKEDFEVYGIELNSAAVEFANNMLGENVVKNKTLKEANFDDNFFDVVVMNHVLEHIPDIPEFLNEAHRILKIGGILVISVPNFGSLIARIQKEKWHGLVPAQHMWQFTPKTLSNLLEPKFSVLRITTNNLHMPLIQRIYWGAISAIDKGDNLFITAIKR